MRRILLVVAGFGALALIGNVLRPSPRVPEPTSPPSPRALVAARAVTPAKETAADGIPIRPAGSGKAPDAPHHPHPITAQHERIYRENNLVASLNGAMDVRDAAGIRRLLAVYREEYPEDEHLLQDGYESIADCLDHPGPESQARAQRYYDEALASNIRRYVRRYCDLPR